MTTNQNKDKSFTCSVGSAQITIHNTDCLEGMKKHLPDESVDVVVTSPPYNIGIDYGAYDDNGSRKIYLDWLTDRARVIKQKLKPDGSFFLNIGSKPSDLLVPFQVEHRLAEKEKLFHLQNTIHWIKSIAIDKKDVGDYDKITDDISVGHYKPVNSDRYLHNCHEFIFHFTKTGDVKLDKLAVGVKYQDKTNIGRWKSASSDLKSRGNTWFIPYETINNREKDRPHPASYPPKLAEMCIKLHGLERTKLVLDPFNGIGNTMTACKNLNIDGVGFEIDEEYYKISTRSFLTEQKSLELE